ncbi:hypothetical protein [Candidatus Enterovibrio escicola]|uniref:hypothetical protein n=1 Tax=Candidatus Enterovibrio escicola TaxID=1927127 RepID=UPI0013143AEB|nr:hypothetical protein [Candidatus Enterovibrio escacola]
MGIALGILLTETIVMEPFLHAITCICCAILLFNIHHTLQGIMISEIAEMFNERHGRGG